MPHCRGDLAAHPLHRRLPAARHEVYVEDSSNYPYNPATLDISDDSYAVQTLTKLASEYGFEGRWAYCARYEQSIAIAGMEREALLKLYKEADCALKICGSHELNA